VTISKPAVGLSVENEISVPAHERIGTHNGQELAPFDESRKVWGYRNETASNVVDVVVRCAGKLGVESSVVETVRGIGYRYRMPASAP
jgi:DNA-binding response OmpR family regulator